MDKSGKRNRFLDALAGRNVQEEPEKFPEIPLKDMVQTLKDEILKMVEEKSE